MDCVLRFINGQKNKYVKMIFDWGQDAYCVTLVQILKIKKFFETFWTCGQSTGCGTQV